MVPKNKRLTKPLFNKVFSEGGRIKTAYFSGRHLPGVTSAWAVVAPSSVFKKAHQRNRARRLAYGAIANLLKDHKPKKPGQTILIYQKISKDLSGEEIYRDLSSLFS